MTITSFLRSLVPRKRKELEDPEPAAGTTSTEHAARLVTEQTMPSQLDHATADPAPYPTTGTTEPSRCPLNPVCYPHLARHIISLAEPAALVALRATSRTMRDLCDARLALHLIVAVGNERLVFGEARQSYRTVSFGAPGTRYRRGRKPNGDIPGLVYLSHDSDSTWAINKPLTDPEMVPHSVRRVLAHVQVVDIKHELAIPLRALAPFMTRVHTVRFDEYDSHGWDGVALPLKPKTLIVGGTVGPLNHHNLLAKPLVFEPMFMVPDGVETLVVNAVVDRPSISVRTEGWSANSSTHPDTLRNVVVNIEIPWWDTYRGHASDSDASSDPEDSSDSEDSSERNDTRFDDTQFTEVVHTLVDATFGAQQFCDHLGSVKYTFVNTFANRFGHSVGVPDENMDAPERGTEAFKSLATMRIEELISEVGTMSKNDIADAIAKNVEFLSEKQYSARIGWRKWRLYCDKDYDASHLDDNGWVVTLDPEIVDKVEGLETTFLKQAVPFACKGSVPLVDSLADIALYVQDRRGGSSATRVSLPLDDHSLKVVYDAGEKSPFGRGNELQYDETYRSAHELKPPNFALSVDPVLHGSILRTVERVMDMSTPIRATLAKLNVYMEGGFFKAHRDTPRGDSHIGTLTLCLPSTFSGGELVVRHNGRTLTCDWATDVLPQDAGSPTSIGWAFLYADCDHEVLPVTSGARVTLAYDVFTDAATASEDLSSVQNTGYDTVLDGMRTMLDDPTFKPNGGILAFGLQHSYPHVAGGQDFTPSLKGIDASWARALTAAGVKYEFVAVYDIYRFELGYSDWNERRRRLFKLWKMTYRGRLFFASHNFNLFENEYIETELEEDCKGKGVAEHENVLWVTLPGEYGRSNHYMAYGNEPSAETIYVAVAIYAYIGPAGRRGDDREIEEIEVDEDGTYAGQDDDHY